MLVRVAIDKTDDTGKQQTVQATGRHRERFGGQKHGAHRMQAYPLSTHLPAGSQALVAALNGSPDMPVIIGGEHPDKRPKDLAEGEWKLYDAFDADNLVHAKDGEWIVKHKTKLTLQVGTSKIIITEDKIEIEADDIVLKPNGGFVFLGGADATRLASASGSVDSAGHTQTSNLATKVKVK